MKIRGINKLVAGGTSFGSRLVRSVAIAIFLLCVFGGVVMLVLSGPRPPNENQLIAGFHAHMKAFEGLRVMMQADKDLVRVASWGVETTKSVGVQVPPEGGLPLGRYREYLKLLNQAGGSWAFRPVGDQNELVAVGVWASGFGGDTRHIEICWLAHEPDNLVASIEDHRRDPKRSRRVFRHIEGSWYLYSDF